MSILRRYRKRVKEEWKPGVPYEDGDPVVLNGKKGKVEKPAPKKKVKKNG
jgi:hypothetical protein